MKYRSSWKFFSGKAVEWLHLLKHNLAIVKLFFYYFLGVYHVNSSIFIFWLIFNDKTSQSLLELKIKKNNKTSNEQRDNKFPICDWIKGNSIVFIFPLLLDANANVTKNQFTLFTHIKSVSNDCLIELI